MVCLLSQKETAARIPDVNPDLYFKKIIPFRYRGGSLQFRVSQLLFSSHRIDAGTRLLLRSLEQLPVGSVGRLLDVGCGYGPIGLSLVKAGVAAEAHLVDRDALAVEYTRQNAVLNGLAGASVYGSLGYSDVPGGDFDLIVMNVPGKAGDRVIASLLAGASGYLAPGGLVAVVIVDALGDYAASVLGTVGGLEIVHDDERSGYRLIHYRFADSGAERTRDVEPLLETYLRDEFELDPDGAGAPGGAGPGLQVAHGLPDFEGPGLAAGLLMEALDRSGEAENSSGGKGVAVFNPGQGYVPVQVWDRLRPARLSLIGPDLLALRYSRWNLTENGCPDEGISLCHQIGPGVGEQGPVALLAVLLRGNEDAAESSSLAAAFSLMVESGGRLLVAGKSTSVTRLAAALERQGGLRVVDRKKRRGFGFLAARKSG